MGLEVSVYSGLNAAADQLVCSADDENSVLFGGNERAFAARAEDIGRNTIYTYTDSEDGWCSSYSRYNRWRESLAQMAGYPSVDHLDGLTGQTEKLHAASAWNAAGGPFWELINFTDCDGVIGSACSAKLARDFAEHQASADAHEDKSFRDGYATWRKSFEMAANEGAVHFH